MVTFLQNFIAMQCIPVYPMKHWYTSWLGIVRQQVINIVRDDMTQYGVQAMSSEIGPDDTYMVNQVKICLLFEVKPFMMTSSDGNIFRVTGYCAGNSPMIFPHKGQWRRSLIFSLNCAWINGWVNNGEAGDLKCHRAYYDVILIVVARSSVLNHWGIVTRDDAVVFGQNWFRQWGVASYEPSLDHQERISIKFSSTYDHVLYQNASKHVPCKTPASVSRSQCANLTLVNQYSIKNNIVRTISLRIAAIFGLALFSLYKYQTNSQPHFIKFQLLQVCLGTFFRYLGYIDCYTSYFMFSSFAQEDGWTH